MSVEQFIVKSSADAERQERKNRESQDALFAAIGLTRDDFPRFLGIAPDDEHIVVWCSGPRLGKGRVTNLVDVELGEEPGDVIYRFLPLDVDAFQGTAAVEGL